MNPLWRLDNLALANDANRLRFNRRFDGKPLWKCRLCGIEKRPTVHQKRKKYCSESCMAKFYRTLLRGSSNPNYKASGVRVCETCHLLYPSYSKTRRFCSIKCRDNSEGYVRGRARKDANHTLIVDAIRKLGGSVLDLSALGRGVPDLCVLTHAGIQLAEIKSPRTSYGKDLSEWQKKWADEWQGAPIYIIRTVEDAAHLVNGDFHLLQGRGGFDNGKPIKYQSVKDSDLPF